MNKGVGGHQEVISNCSKRKCGVKGEPRHGGCAVVLELLAEGIRQAGELSRAQAGTEVLPLYGRPAPYSRRSAATGSALTALRAGVNDATSPTAASNTAAAAIPTGSPGFTS